MKKSHFYFVLICLLLCVKLSSQVDTILFKDHSREAVNITEVNSTVVKYRRADNPTGPSYIIPLTEVSYIIYRNGRKEIYFGEQPKEVKHANPAIVAQQKMLNAAKSKRYAGPRVGCTFIGEGFAADYILDKGKTPVVSQFGWQFETRVFSTNSGISGLVEFLPFIAGMEQGMFLPSGSLMLGIRGRNGIELSAGPVLSGTGLSVNVALTGSLRFEDMLIPISLQFVPNVTKETTEYSLSGTPHSVIENTGYRISLIIGFSALND